MDKSTAGLFEQINYSSYFGSGKDYTHISLHEYFDQLFGNTIKRLKTTRLKIHSYKD